MEIRPQDALPERTFIGGQYRIGKVIGRGGFGITYLADDLKRGCQVVIKELYPKNDVYREAGSLCLLPQPGQEKYFQYAKKRFRQEAQLLYSFLKEPLVLDVYRFMEENQTVYYSMEFLRGMDMKSYIRRNMPTGWRHMRAYVKSILRALSILHEKKLIHRDISPDNIYLVSETQAKLIDFGSVRCYDDGQRLTTVLKQIYAPPEQYFSDGEQGPWTDIYSLSATLYHVLGAVRPPKAPDRVVKDKMIRLDSIKPQIPEHVSRGIEKGMSMDAANRFQDISQMAQALFPGENIFEDPRLCCIAGRYRGKSWQIGRGQEITVGRDPQCGIHYPPRPDDSPGISWKHCVFRCESNGQFMVKDLYSTYGTVLSGRRIVPAQWRPVDPGCCVIFAGEKYLIQ